MIRAAVMAGIAGLGLVLASAILWVRSERLERAVFAKSGWLDTGRLARAAWLRGWSRSLQAAALVVLSVAAWLGIAAALAVTFK